MGYKSIMRSGIAIVNKSIKEGERAERQQQRETDKMLKKIEAVKEKIQKIKNELENQYAQGKIDKEQFEKFKLRENEISIDMVVIGKTPMITLAKRYVTGKIDKDEFERIIAVILPSDFIEGKSFLSPIKEIGKNKLCGKCTKQLKSILKFKGFDGKYFTAQPEEISIDKLNEFVITIELKSELL